MNLTISENDWPTMTKELKATLLAWASERLITEQVVTPAGTGSENYTETDLLAGPLPLDVVALEVLYEGVNDAGKAILRCFADEGDPLLGIENGRARVKDLMKAVGAKTLQHLNGPMGGTVRKLRSMFGGKQVVLWSYNESELTYDMHEDFDPDSYNPLFFPNCMLSLREFQNQEELRIRGDTAEDRKLELEMEIEELSSRSGSEDTEESNQALKELEVLLHEKMERNLWGFTNRIS